MIIEFRCPRCNALLARVDEACPVVEVPCRNCKQPRQYRPVSDPHHWDYARLPEAVGQQQ
jgi:phage FluMu protein Com